MLENRVSLRKHFSSSLRRVNLNFALEMVLNGFSEIEFDF